MSSGDWSGGDDNAGGDWSGGNDAGSSGGDSYSESSSEGWLSRVGKAFLAIPIGLLLFGVSFVVLFWNEGRAVHTAQGLAEGKGNVVSVPADKVDPAHEAKLVHLTGEATSDETLKDPQFGLAAPKAIRLRRIVQMYQWIETKETRTRKKGGGGTEQITTYEYNKNWSDHQVDSSRFKKSADHRNPDNWPFTAWTGQAQTVTLGAFRLPDSLVRQIGNAQPLSIGQGEFDALPDEIKSPLKLDGSRLYRGDDPANPKIGDMTIAFEQVRPQTVSLLAKQVGGSFEAYPTQAGTTIERLQAGTASAAEMFQAAEAENSALTWILRLVGFVLMAVGIAMVLSPLSVLADVIPFIGDIVGYGTGFLAIGFASIFSLVTIAIGWIAYRPIVGISILAVAGLILFAVLKLGRNRRAARPPRPARA